MNPNHLKNIQDIMARRKKKMRKPDGEIQVCAMTIPLHGNILFEIRKRAALKMCSEAQIIRDLIYYHYEFDTQ